MLGTYLGTADEWFARRWGRIIRPVLLVLFLWLLARTKSRGPLLARVAGSTVLVLMSKRTRQRRAWLFVGWAGVAATVAAVVLDFGDDRITRVLFRNQSAEAVLSLTGRTELLQVAFDLWKQRPILGYGYLSGSSYFLEYFEWAGEAHNVGVEIGFSFGVVGLMVWGFLLARTARRLWNGWKWGPTHRARFLAGEGVAVFAFVMVIGVVGQGFAGTPGHQQIALFWTVLLADLVGSASRKRRIHRDAAVFRQASTAAGATGASD